MSPHILTRYITLALEPPRRLELRFLHVMSVDLKLPFRCQRHLFIESPTSRMASEMSGIGDLVSGGMRIGKGVRVGEGGGADESSR